MAVSAMTVRAADGFPIGLLITLIILVIFVVVIGFVVWIQDGERRIHVQYSKKMVGRQMYGGQSSFIPIKVNIAGVMSIIFAISLLQFPQTIAQFFVAPPAWLATTVEWLNITHPCGAVLYVILIFCFTFFYTSFAINPVEMAENMKKNGGFVPGIRPGKPTTDYIQRTIDRLSWIGAIFYAMIAMIPVLIEWIFQFQAGFGGTTLLIVTGVALELVKQLESQLLMRHHKGFLS
jgi:preprotein translocase subunit SecY